MGNLITRLRNVAKWLLNDGAGTRAIYGALVMGNNRSLTLRKTYRVAIDRVRVTTLNLTRRVILQTKSHKNLNLKILKENIFFLIFTILHFLKLFSATFFQLFITWK